MAMNPSGTYLVLNSKILQVFLQYLSWLDSNSSIISSQAITRSRAANSKKEVETEDTLDLQPQLCSGLEKSPLGAFHNF